MLEAACGQSNQRGSLSGNAEQIPTSGVSINMRRGDLFDDIFDDDDLTDPWGRRLFYEAPESGLRPEDIEDLVQEGREVLRQRGLLGMVMESLPPEQQVKPDDPDLLEAMRKLGLGPANEN